MNTVGIALPEAVETYLQQDGFGRIVAREQLHGGAISTVTRLIGDCGRTMIVKQHLEAPEDMYACEAAGLRALRLPGCPTVPEVYLAGPQFFLLQDLGSKKEQTPAYWETFGRQVATLHRHTHTHFGFSQDNYLGKKRMSNRWTEDGYAFYAQTRVLFYLEQPDSELHLTADDRRNLERLCDRLPQLMPKQPASLIHGDLWHANLLVGLDGEPAYIDPATHYGWAEADLSMSRQYGVIPETFFAAYQEVNPLPDGWWERLELFYLKELLSMIVHFGNQYGNVDQLRKVVAKFL